MLTTRSTFVAAFRAGPAQPKTKVGVGATQRLHTQIHSRGRDETTPSLRVQAAGGGSSEERSPPAVPAGGVRRPSEVPIGAAYSSLLLPLLLFAGQYGRSHILRGGHRRDPQHHRRMSYFRSSRPLERFPREAPAGSCLQPTGCRGAGPRCSPQYEGSPCRFKRMGM